MAWGKCTPQTAIAVQDSDRCSPTQPEHGNRGNSLAISAIAGWQPNGASWLDMARVNTANNNVAAVALGVIRWTYHDSEQNEHRDSVNSQSH